MIYFSDLSGNHFGMKFEKVPNKFYPLDIVHGDDENAKKGKTIQEAGFDSKLDKAVQKLIKMIFDIEMMKRAMVEFEVAVTVSNLLTLINTLWYFL